VTLDETWLDLPIFYLSIFLSFYLSIDHESIWRSPEDEAPQKDSKRELSPKMMLAIVWNPDGFHLTNVLPKSSKFNAGHDISHILSPLPKFLLLIKMNQGDIL
jgi:hypothetical protein